MKKKTQKQIIIEKLQRDGYVDNIWAIENKITTRLGAVILVLKNEGFVFDEERSGFITNTKNWRYYLTSAPEKRKSVFVMDAGRGVMVEIL